MNLLYYGDNLDVLRRHVADESVDLVYLDPPFNSNANYNVLFEEHGTRAAAQIEAFEDTWEWDESAAAAYQDVVEQGGPVANAMVAFRQLLGPVDMLAYLSMMAPRLIELHRALKTTGSLYLHCDPTASHYLKLLLDAVFGPKNFRNEIVWKRAQTVKGNFGQGSRFFGRQTDSILFYTKTDRYQFHQPFTAYSTGYVDGAYRHVEPGTGRRYRLVSMIGPGGAAKGNPKYEVMGVEKYWRYSKDHMRELIDQGLVVQTTPGTVPSRKYYLDEGKGVPVQSLWDDLNSLQAASAERLGYPTQKPVALLERIIEASSNPGDTILDPFCGCGTALDAAQELDRQWIGIDITHLAIGLIKGRLADRYPSIASTYRVIGEPTTVEDAKVLAAEDKFQFQAWALGLVGARIATSAKKGGDGGIDGRLYFHDSPGDETRQIVFSVKGGEHLVPAFVHELHGVVDAQKAAIGVLITFKEPTAGMRAEAANAGFYTSPWGKHPRIQLRTVGELLAGKGIDYPHVTGANVTVRKAQRAAAPKPEELELFGRAAEPPEGYDSDA